MGAYYRGVMDGVMYDSEKLGGLKLLEHSYIRNSYVYAFIKELTKKGSAKVVWLCDYHESDDKVPYQWYWEDKEGNEKKITILNLPKVVIPADFYKYMEKLERFYKKNRYIANMDEHQYFDAYEIFSKEMENYKYKENSDWYIHPLPILTASDDDYMGGGDACKEDYPFRASWRNDTITVFKKPPEGYKNITESVAVIDK